MGGNRGQWLQMMKQKYGSGAPAPAPASTPDGRYSFFDPMGSAQKIMDTADLQDPTGNRHLYGALRDQAISSEGDRRRGALTGLAARGGDVQGGYGVGAMLSDLSGQSDLSRNLAGARAESIDTNARFRAGLLQQLLGIQSGEQRANSDYARELDRMRQAKAINKPKKKKGFDIGGIGVHWS
jgi:hypothetical protein